MATNNGRGKRGAGRAARHQQRQTEGAIPHPCPPGQIGGTYQPLSEQNIKDIVDTAFRLLENLGMGEVPDYLEEAALKMGAHLNADGRLCYRRELVEEIIEGTPKNFTLHAREAKHDIEVGGQKVYFGTAGAAVQTLDIDTQLYRPSTVQDVYNFAKLGDKLENLAWFSRTCVGTDIEDIVEADINQAYSLCSGTSKHIGTSFNVAESVAPVMELFDLVAGGEGKFKERPFCKVHLTSILSPMRYGEDAVAIAREVVKYNMPVNAIIAAQAGATAPAPLAGMLVQTTAEALAALMMINAFSRGHQVIFSNWPFVVDLRTGSFSGSGGEISVLNAGAAQIANYLGLVGGVATSMADAKAVDAQMGAEKTLSATAAGLAGANLVYESAGMMASLLGVSFEAMMLDNEMIANIQRTIRGFEVSEETLGYDAIINHVMNDGHFLGGEQTMGSMLRDYYYPKLANRDNPTIWAESGSPDAWGIAKQKVKEILGAPREAYVDDATDMMIRERFNIHLPPEAM
ncbi:MAG: trimethylamine methyltransferase family protein [Candidatus Puniceispirillaceae bacterium]